MVSTLRLPAFSARHPTTAAGESESGQRRDIAREPAAWRPCSWKHPQPPDSNPCSTESGTGEAAADRWHNRLALDRSLAASRKKWRHDWLENPDATPVPPQ